jgi:hypothetical protein
MSRLLQMLLYVTVSVSDIKFGIRFLEGDPVSQWTSGYELGTDRSNKIVTHHLEASHVRFRVVAQPVCRCIATTPTCPRQETSPQLNATSGYRQGQLEVRIPIELAKPNAVKSQHMFWQLLSLETKC